MVRQRSSSVPELGLSLVLEKPVCGMEADVVALVSTAAGQAQAGGRQAAQAWPGKRWLVCSEGKRDVEVAV